MIARSDTRTRTHRPLFRVDLPTSPAHADAQTLYARAVVRWLVAVEAERVASLAVKSAVDDLLGALRLLDRFDR